MAIINDVKALGDRLGQLRWRDFFWAATNNALDSPTCTGGDLALD